MRKGGGLFKKTINFFTRRKRPFRSRNLSDENARRKNTLKTIKRKTQQEAQELELLEARLAPPEKIYQNELALRTPFQKFFNRSTKATLSPKKILQIPIEGISEVYQNSRKPFNKARARIPNNMLLDPPMVEASEFRVINGRKIPIASQILVECMNIPLLYAMWRGEPPKAKLEDIPEEDFQEFAESIRGHEDLDTVAREIFHMPGGVEDMATWILNHEQGEGYERGEYRIQEYEQQQPDGSYEPREVVMIPGAVTFGRYLARITQGKEKILRAKETNDHTCPGYGENNPSSFAPLTTLKSNGCFTIYNGEEIFNNIGMSRENNAPKHIESTMLRKNWMILDPRYFPIKSTPLFPLMAKYFGIATYIQEALENWGVQGIDALFLELLQLKYPEFAIKFTTYILNSQDYSYQRQKLKEFENFFLLDKSIFPEVVGFTAKNPFQESSMMFPFIEKAARDQKLYGMSTYGSYAMKKFGLPLWKQAFPSEAAKRNLAVYERLTEQEKITIDYLQHLHFEERLVSTGYDFAQARDSYNEEIGSGTTREGMIEELLSVYLSDGANHRRQLLFYQTIVTKTYKGELVVPKITRNDLVHLLTKFVARDSSGLSMGAPANNGPRFPAAAVAAPAAAPATASPATAAAALPREVVWGDEEEEEENIPPLRKINLTPASGFGANRNAALNKTRKRKAELETYLEKAQRTYNVLLPRIAELESRSRFLTAKKRYNRLSSAELKNLKNFQTLQEFQIAKPIAERELKQLQRMLSKLPATSTMP